MTLSLLLEYPTITVISYAGINRIRFKGYVLSHNGTP
jgi:hypothetical protein